ncbi:MAG: response regulator [Proteobacteria bacterium]|nr:response regulator [Pseudomonadota bacterium]MBU1452124.1 response regulator [Pseudomonadota bacterium]MBU2467519.1 response regulator [Pseudomonadota bacterium]MBU2517924.1 response regulator [Pseudomonadota bacterium]
MSVVNIFSGSFCSGEEVATGVADRLGCQLVRDEDVIARLARDEGLKAGALRRALYGKPSVFNQFSHERERALSQLKEGVALLLAQENLVLLGFLSHLVPRTISHVLDVCLVAEVKWRAMRAARELGLNEKEALARVRRDDEAAFRWAEYLNNREPWAPELFDMRLSMDHTLVAEAVELICDNAASQVLAVSPASRRAVADFALASRVEVALSENGHNPQDAQVTAKDGAISILINKKVMFLGRFSEELEKLASVVEGVKEVKVEPGPNYYQADVYRRADFQLPSKVLLVDDEQEFVQTLSERLMLREIGSAVVHDGEEALRVAAEDEPDVIVLDLKMPGIDGVEVLKRLKRDHPGVEVIILTGHGSEADRDLCMSLGAFAYLEKPVDIERLSEAMQGAYDLIKKRKE